MVLETEARPFALVGLSPAPEHGTRLPGEDGVGRCSLRGPGSLACLFHLAPFPLIPGTHEAGLQG